MHQLTSQALPALIPDVLHFLSCWLAVQGEPVWQALLRLAVERRVDAVLDCGAQLAGTSNRLG